MTRFPTYPPDILSRADALLASKYGTDKPIDPLLVEIACEAMMAEDWRPIETAPRDGTEFLAYDETTGKMDVCEMEYFLGEWRATAVQSDGEYGAFNGDFGGDKIGADGSRTFSVIRHWQPLPAPPSLPSPGTTE